MPFDFNEQPVRLYGIYPQTPFPVEVSIYGYCQMACSFCFANRNRDATGRELHQKNSAPALAAIKRFEPTSHLPGTAEKIAVMRARHSAGHPLHHPGDVR